MSLTPAEATQRLLYLQAARLGPELRAAFVALLHRLRLDFEFAEIAALVQRGRFAEAVNVVLGPRRWEPAVQALRDAVLDGVRRSGRWAAAQLPPFQPTPRSTVLRVQFNVTHPAVLESTARYTTTILDGIRTEFRGAMLQHIQAGVERGINPRDIARDLRGVVGLTTRQEAAVRNFERMLRAGDREALTRALRDRRFDPTFRRVLAGEATLTEGQISRMVSAYRARYIAYHAETLTRTVALDIQRDAQLLAWEQAITAGLVRREDLIGRWVTAKDERVRVHHAIMEGQTQPLGEPFDVPVDGLTLIPGRTVSGRPVYNCRCTLFVRPRPGSDIPLPRAA